MIKVIFFDLDGTVYYGSKLIDGADKVIKKCRESGYKVYFLTNNSTKTRKQIYEKLVKMGIECDYQEVITSGYIATLYALREKMKDVFVFGSDGLKKEFMDAGITVVEDSNAHNLIIGYDMDFKYEALTTAMNVAFNAKCIIACNKERYYPGENGILMPGCGAMVASIEWCCDRIVDYVIGKPNTLMIDMMCSQNNVMPDETIMIGDTYESDITMAHKAGSHSIYIGNNVYADTFCVKHISELLDCDFESII